MRSQYHQIKFSFRLVVLVEKTFPGIEAKVERRILEEPLATELLK